MWDTSGAHQQVWEGIGTVNIGARGLCDGIQTEEETRNSNAEVKSILSLTASPWPTWA